MPNCVITGGLGSGGSYLAEYIINNHPEYQVWIPARWHSTSSMRNIEHIKDKVKIVECDLNDLPSIIRFLNDCKPEKIFNMAATANVAVAFKTPLSVLQNNIFSTANLLEAVRICCSDTTFVHCSTSEVCGNPKEFPITENHPLNPCNPYAISKLTTEKLAICYFNSWGIKTIITRAFAYINPRRYDLVASNFALQVARIEAGKQFLVENGNLESIRTFMDVRDMAEAYWIASEKCIPGEPYNIGGENPIMVGMILSILKYKAKVPIVNVQSRSLLRPTDITNQVPDISKFYEHTGWKAKIPLDESINWLLNHMREVVKNEN